MGSKDLVHFPTLAKFFVVMVNDVFGIKMIYPPNPDGQEWFMDDNPEADGQLDSDPENIVKVGDYFTVTNSSSLFLAVTGVAGFPPADCAVDHGELASTGFRYQTDDWRNQEQTVFMYFQDVVESSSGPFQVIRGRDFARSDTGAADCCERVRYNIRIYHAASGSDAGKVQFSKHIAGVTTAGPEVVQTVVPTFYRRWVGHKFIIYNILGSNNQEQVKLEHWICPSDSATDKANAWTMVNSMIDTGSNFGSSSAVCGGQPRQAITWGNVSVGIIFDGDELRFKNWSVREIDIDGSFGGGGGGSGGGGTSTGNCGSTDSRGIKWMLASGAATTMPQTRDQADDDRWSKNFDNIDGGWEATVIATFPSGSVTGDGHIAMKMWGGNHSGSGFEDQRWYDIGIRSNGDIQTQWEGPHPNNHDFTPDPGEKLVNNIGHGMDGQSVGLKWLIYPITTGGDATHGGIKIKLWYDPDPLVGGVPRNDWRLALDITDTGTIISPAGYHADSTQELEMRNSNTEERVMYGGGLHMRYINRAVDFVPCVPGGGGGDGGGDGGGGDGGGPTDPVCPTGFHWDAARQLCVADSGGGTNPDPPTPETLYNDFTILYNINSDSDGCICNPPPFVPPPPPCPPGQHLEAGVCVPDTLPPCPTGQHRDITTGLCVPDTTPPPVVGTALYNISNTGSDAEEVKIGHNSGSSSYYLQFGVELATSDCNLIGKVAKRMEIALKKQGEPEGVATVVVRNFDNDDVESTLGTIDVTQLTGTAQYMAVENLAATYVCQEDDHIVIEYDEGSDDNNYIIAWTKDGLAGNGYKVIKRANSQSPGNYTDRDQEFACRIYA